MALGVSYYAAEPIWVEEEEETEQLPVDELFLGQLHLEEHHVWVWETNWVVWKDSAADLGWPIVVIEFQDIGHFTRDLYGTDHWAAAVEYEHESSSYHGYVCGHHHLEANYLPVGQ